VSDALVLDASAMVTLLVGGTSAHQVSRRIVGSAVHVPAHFDAEVLSALGRLHRASEIDARDVDRSLDAVASAPFERHPLGPLLGAAWSRRSNVRLVDALYIALAVELGVPIVTLDRGLAAAAHHAELLEV
jgi:predicted nucleic acid-binding protein